MYIIIYICMFIAKYRQINSKNNKKKILVLVITSLNKIINYLTKVI